MLEKAAHGMSSRTLGAASCFLQVARKPKCRGSARRPRRKTCGSSAITISKARSAHQPTIHHQKDPSRLYYIGHHGGTDAVPCPLDPLTGQAEFNGTSIIDVTDPAHPVYVHHLPGQNGNDEQGGRRW